MRFIETDISGAWLIMPTFHQDDRGRFARTWCATEFAEHGLDFNPVQMNLGYNILKGTTRGMHLQDAPALEAKLVRCTKGMIFDVVLDLRPDSPTYGKWYGTVLSDDNASSLFLPEGCAHGYQTLVDGTEMSYMASASYTPRAARGVRYDDPVFGIEWPLTATVMSDQDRNWPLLE